MKNFYNWVFDKEIDMNKTILSTQTVEYTNQDILDETDRYITLLTQLGDLKGKKVALIIPTIHSLLTMVLAISKLGGILIPLSPLLRRNDLEKVLDFSDPHVVFTVKEFNGFNLSEAVNNWGTSTGKETVIFESDKGSKWEKTILTGEKRQLENEDIQIIGCTSGSTGTPKGIVSSLDTMIEAIKQYSFIGEVTSQDKLFLIAPSSNLFGLCWLLSSLHAQYHMVATESFSFPEIIELLKEKPCQKLITTPSLFNALRLFSKTSDNNVLEPLTLVSLAGEPITASFIESVADMKTKITGFYGTSEMGCMLYTDHDIRDGLSWSLLPGVEYKFEGQTEDGSGELLFRNGLDFYGYYKRPDLTEEVYLDGWFYSGDLANLNENGKFEIIGRKKDMIKKGGQQVIPGEIETLLAEHPNVQKAVVIGAPHPIFGEQVVAFIVAEIEMDVKELYQFCDDKIARYKVPDQIHFIDEIPTSQGKIDKVSLRQMALGIKK
ncbi:class I adenylate-forming enzyme family protein [Bacillus sp. CECT 9360]|uniref:class I adenylate-forming enzyme family protein n=1 Tax=Bacillus sp. CECT 9360 TaxID=2845821 RepID=UPI001E3C4C46|nr:class I adenylate-forming enzyme family protein [Bacillus sp. CECT 9360]CAH0346423.1 Long-chain-fatty-acid--CoA ligase FadD13 [Bacillus sp. CECT 9360]